MMDRNQLTGRQSWQSLIGRLGLALALLAGMLWAIPAAPAQAAYAGAGNALDFDGTDDYVVTAIAPSLNMGGSSFTIELWIWGDNSLSYTTERLLVEYGAWQEGTYQLTTDNDGHFRVNFYGRSSTAGSNATVDWSDSQWHHLAGVFDNSGNTLKTYFDGVLQNTTAETNAPGNVNRPLYLGARGGTANFSDIKLDEVRIWSTARTEAEIRANMYKELSGSGANLKAYYQMSDGLGTILTDDSANINTGSLRGGMGDANWVTSGAFAGPRNALDFDGTDDYVDLGTDVDLRPTSALTVELWAYRSSWASVASAMHLVSNWTGGTGGYCFQLTSTPAMQFWVQNGGNQSVSASTSSLSSGWHHFAGTYGGGNLRIYVDGVEGTPLTSLSGSIQYDVAVPTTLGADPNASAPLYDDFFSGQLDEVRIWNTARTATEIRDNMFRTLDGDESGLQAYYRFDQYNASGQTTLYDITANSNDGTLTTMDPTTDWVSSTAFNTWIGSTSTDWATAGNWSRGSVPAATDNVGIYSYTGGNNANLNSTVTVDDLVVATGGTLDLGGSANLTVSGMDFVNGTVNRSSSVVSSETRSISGAGTQTYNLADGTVDVQTLGTLSSLQVQRTESAHAQENANGGGANILDRYYTFTPNASPGSFSVDICLSYTDAELGGLTEANLRLCRWTGSAWTCPVRGTNSDTTANRVCADGVTQFSDWVMGGVGSDGGPTAVILASLTARPARGGNGFTLPLALVAVGAVGGALVLWARRRR